MENLILTGWGWNEYAVAAAVALRALEGQADVRGISRRRLPEFLHAEGCNWKRIYLIGLGLAGDESLFRAALEKLEGQTEVIWISGIPLAENHRKLFLPILKTHVTHEGSFGGALVRAVGEAFNIPVAAFLPYIVETAKPAKAVAPVVELLAAVLHAHRANADEESYAQAIRYLADGTPETNWSSTIRHVIDDYRRSGGRELIGTSAPLVELKQAIARIARHPEARVLILGESGTGKETVALQIHLKSPRAHEPFCAFNCASVNKGLLESRFFGHEKGAFTGADRQTQGLFEQADGGTLFLDEIGELPLEAQGLLLRVLEGGRFQRVGGQEELTTDVRLVTATNRDLAAMVRAGTFRQDLYMRLNVVQIRVPSLREHLEDVGAIADAWWFRRFRKHLAESQIAALKTYSYPGNVRELLNLLERAAVLDETDFGRLVENHRSMNASLLALPADDILDVEIPDELEEVVRAHIKNVFRKYEQNLSRAAAALKISRSTMRRYLQNDPADGSK